MQSPNLQHNQIALEGSMHEDTVEAVYRCMVCELNPYVRVRELQV